MEIVKSVLVSSCLLLVLSCERAVEIENPYPVQASYCNVKDSLLGHWQSDSVWVLTEVDSLDSVLVNTRPTYYYDIRVNCAEDTTFLMEYINYGGAVTREVYSTNYGTTDSSFAIYDQLDFEPSPENSTFELDYQITSDSTFSATYFQELNTDQRTRIWMWMSKVP